MPCRDAHAVNQPRSIAAAAMPADNSALLQTAQRQFNAGNYSAAITTLQSAITRISSSGEAYYWLGRVFTMKFAIMTMRLPPVRSPLRWIRKIPFTINGWEEFTEARDHNRIFSYATKGKEGIRSGSGAESR